MSKDNSKRIREIDEIIQAGATTVVVDGETTTYNFAELRKERRQLMLEDPTEKKRRPVVSTINLGGF